MPLEVHTHNHQQENPPPKDKFIMIMKSWNLFRENKQQARDELHFKLIYS